MSSIAALDDQHKEKIVAVTYDREADAAYLPLMEIPPGGVADTVVSPVAELPTMVNLDFDASYRLVGIEILDASHILLQTFLQERRMVLTYRPRARLAYLSFAPGLTVTAQERLQFQDPEDPDIGLFRIAFDLDESRRLIGVEVQDADRWLTEESLKGAEIIEG